MTQENALKIFKCLSDTSRLNIIQSLTQGEMYTELLAERLELTPPTVSFHMKKLEDAGVTVMTCGTCLDFYGLKAALKVGIVSNMYDIVEAQMGASLIIRP